MWPVTRATKRFTTCASKAARCSLRSRSMFNNSGRGRLFEFKRLGLQSLAGKEKTLALVGRFAFDDENLDRSKELGELSLVTHGQKNAQDARVVVAKDDRALVRQFDLVKFAQVVPQCSQVALAEQKNAPM